MFTTYLLHVPCIYLFVLYTVILKWLKMDTIIDVIK